MQLRSRLIRTLAAAVVVAGTVVLVAPPASAASVAVTSAANEGSGSFRAAVEAANADPGIDTITFDINNQTIALASEVRFTGPQDLIIEGNGNAVSGASADPDTDTWDSGLFVSESGGDLTITDLEFADSFNNGIGVFLPAGNGKVKIVLDGVTVASAQFHGILVDGQASTGFNTDDIVHLSCTDPHFVDSGTTIDLEVTDTTITGAGQLAGGYDLTLLTGCAQDFDGFRVDQGGNGSITGSIENSTFDSNLADGAELDEKGNGNVDVDVAGTSFSNNGETVEILCSAAYLAELASVDPGEEFDRCDEGDMLADRDDGFDIDEEDNGNLIAKLFDLTVDDNRDEGLDFDEAGSGSIFVTLDGLEADGNTDQAYKASEEDDGKNSASITDAVITNGEDDGIEIEEEGRGNVIVALSDSTVATNGGVGVKIVEAGQGNLRAEVSSATINGNAGEGIEVEQEDKGQGSLEVVDSDLSGNAAPISPENEGENGIRLITLIGVIS